MIYIFSSTSSEDQFGVEEDNNPGGSFFSKYTKNSLEKCDKEKVNHHVKKNIDIEHKDHKKHRKDHKEKSVITHSSNQYYGYKTLSTGEKDLELNELATADESSQTKSESDLQSSEFNPVEDIKTEEIKKYSKEDSKEINSAEFELNAQPQKIPNEKMNAEEMKVYINEPLDLDEPILEESIDHPGLAEELHFDKLVPASIEDEVREVTTEVTKITSSIATETEEEITDSTMQTTNSIPDTSKTVTSTNKNKIDASTEVPTSEIITSSSTVHISSTTVIN